MKMQIINQNEINRETEIGTLPKDWLIVKVEDIFEIQQGKQLSSKEKVGDKIKKPFLRTSNVFWDRINLSNIDSMYFTQEEFEKLSLKKNDILLCEGGDIGRTALWNHELDEVAYQNHLHRLRIINEDKCYPKFFVLWMQYAILLKKMYINNANRTTIPNLSSSRLKKFVFPLPHFVEQKSIAHFLATVQEAQEKTENVIRSLKELKKSLMKHLFTYGELSLEEADKIELRETEIGKVPKDWKVEELRSICKHITDGKHGDCKNEPNSGYYFLSAKDIVDGKVIYSGAREITKDDYLEANIRTRLEIGDVLVTNSGTIGKVAIPTDSEKIRKTTFQKSVAIIKPNTALVMSSFLGYYLSYANSRLKKVARGVAQKNLLLQDLRAFEVPLIGKDVQLRITSVLEVIDRKIDAEEATKRTLDELFKSMLSNLMSAKIRLINLGA